MTHYLLDTCACIWMSSGDRLKGGVGEDLAEAVSAGSRLGVSPAVAWEMSMLASKNRVSIKTDPLNWFRRLLKLPGVRLVRLTPEIFIASSFLPGEAPKDPADRLMAATARAFNLKLVTRDRPLLEYGRVGHVETLAC